MRRIQAFLAVLVALLLILIFWFALWSPAQEDLEALEVSIEDEENIQAQLRATISDLQEVRQDAPAAEARLAAARSVVTGNPALPAALRQLQLAADESGLTLRAVSTARPTGVGDDLGLASINLAVQLEGTYFQTVDFLRRVEDPSITPRAVLWNGVTVTITEHPELSVALSGDLFVIAPIAEQPEEAVDDPEGAEETAEDGDETDGDDEVPDDQEDAA